jgi:hypothetical protein
MKRLLSSLMLLATLHAGSARGDEQRVYSFGVISQRSPILTAQYWNPILQFVAERSGVALELRVVRTGEEHAEACGAASSISSTAITTSRPQTPAPVIA